MARQAARPVDAGARRYRPRRDHGAAALYAADGQPDFIYRLVGTREVEIRGNDPTGRRVAEAFHGPSAENAVGCYRAVVAAKAPLLDDDYFVREGDRYGDEGNLFLPLSNDGQRVNMVIVFTAYRRL